LVRDLQLFKKGRFAMAFQPALCKVGIFAVIARQNGGNVEILINVRTDQEKQQQAAGLPSDWSGKIVDLPGGTLQVGEADFAQCLKREVGEETGGCDAEIIGDFLGPYPLIKPDTGTAEKPHDLAFAALCKLFGEPRPTSEASEHRWVTWQQLEEEQEVRFPGRLGKNGRMAKMVSAALTIVANGLLA